MSGGTDAARCLGVNRSKERKHKHPVQMGQRRVLRAGRVVLPPCCSWVGAQPHPGLQSHTFLDRAVRPAGRAPSLPPHWLTPKKCSLSVWLHLWSILPTLHPGWETPPCSQATPPTHTHTHHGHEFHKQEHHNQSEMQVMGTLRHSRVSNHDF